MKARYTLFSLAALIPFAFASGSSTTNTTEPATCYNLDGSEASDDVPCGTSDVVNCCNANDICMSNGLCYQQGDRGLSLSRGSCTDESWGPSCYAPCSDYNRDSGIAIVNFSFDDDDGPEYCCGGITIGHDHDEDGDEEPELACEFGEPFTIHSGTAIPNVAGLSSQSSTDSHTEDSESDEDNDKFSGVSTGLAIALGVGIPLGLIVLGGVFWAIWERRRRQLRLEEKRGVHHHHNHVHDHDHDHDHDTDTEHGPSHVMRAIHLSGLCLHHRYGPIPSPVPSYPHSGRGTPNGSGVFHPLHNLYRQKSYDRSQNTSQSHSQSQSGSQGHVQFEIPLDRDRDRTQAQGPPDFPTQSPERRRTRSESSLRHAQSREEGMNMF